jgi:hypothetical protein
LDTFNPRVGWPKQAQEVHLTVAAYYQLPVVSYRDAVWHTWRDLAHDQTEGKSTESKGAASGSGRASSNSGGGSTGQGLCATMGLWPYCAEAFWTAKSLHPPWHVHQLLADLIALAFADEHKLGCQARSRSRSPTAASSGGGFQAWPPAALPDAGTAAAGAAGVASAHQPEHSRAVPPLFGHGDNLGGGGGADSHCAVPMSVMSTLRSHQVEKKPLQPVEGHAGWRLEEDSPVCARATLFTCPRSRVGSFFSIFLPVLRFLPAPASSCDCSFLLLLLLGVLFGAMRFFAGQARVGLVHARRGVGFRPDL